jgi:polyhydroxyalkanoate synthesis repressor PhaR
MPIIKRYPNRKLYDTTAKQYITLEGIAELIRQGEEVRVVDYATGEDLTALILTQIIFEQEKKEGGFVPQAILRGLVRAGGDTLSALQRPLAAWGHVDDEIARRIEALVSQRDLTEEEGVRLREKLVAQGVQPRETSRPTEQAIQQALARRGVPTRDELQRLIEQVEELTAKLDKIGRRKKPTASPSKRPQRRR